MIYIGNGMYSDSGEYLQHYGVLGMKWGLHKAKQYVSSMDYGYRRAKDFDDYYGKKNISKREYKKRMKDSRKHNKEMSKKRMARIEADARKHLHQRGYRVKGIYSPYRDEFRKNDSRALSIMARNGGLW